VKEELPEAESLVDRVELRSHSVKQIFNNETLPPSEEMFDDSEELKFQILDKEIPLSSADFSQCPRDYYDRCFAIVEEFSDRFSRWKLDIEVTDKYEAELETKPGRSVRQAVRPLPPHKFDFALKAVKQLEEAGVVTESNSTWRSNVVMVPKPLGKDELRANTKADYQTGSQNKAQHYRICLDFRDLNKILEFPQMVAFPTIEKFLHKSNSRVR
jgi:hypothetical protein